MKAVTDFLAETDPRAWAVESYGPAVDTAYAGIGPGDSPDAEYEARWRQIAEARVAVAGYRLAAMLDRLAPKG